MYRTASGEEIFVIDGHTHFWDGSPANQKNIHGKQFIECFYAYHSNLSPPSEKWPQEKFEKYDAKTMYDDLFVQGYDDMAILQPTYLDGFLQERLQHDRTQFGDEEEPSRPLHPQRRVRSARRRSKGSRICTPSVEKYKIKGVKLYTAEWRGEVKGYKLTDQESYTLPRGGAKARHQEYPRPQGADDHSR